MTYSIYKFGLELAGDQMLYIQKGARLLHVQQQPLTHTPVQLWALVDRDAPMVQRHIRCFPTGIDVPAEPGKYIGTVLHNGGSTVWHFYDAGEVKQ